MGPIFLRKEKRLRQHTQKLGTPKILVPKKTESPRGGASQYAGVHWGLQAPCQGSGGLEAPQEQQGVWGAAAPPVRKIVWTQSQDFGTRIYHEPIVNLIIMHLS